MFCLTDLPFCIERIGPKRITVPSALQAVNERGVLKLQIPLYYLMDTFLHSQTLGLGQVQIYRQQMQLGPCSLRSMGFELASSRFISDPVTIFDEIHLVPKDVSAAVVTITLCLASVHGLKSFLNLMIPKKSTDYWFGSSAVLLLQHQLIPRHSQDYRGI